MTIRLSALSLPVLLLACSTGTSDPVAPLPTPVAQRQASESIAEPAASSAVAPRVAEAPAEDRLAQSSVSGTEHAMPAEAVPGEKIYGTYCASCHGPSGKGDGPAAKALVPRPADLTQPRTGPHKSGKSRWQIIMSGSDATAMQAFSKILKPEQLDDLHVYLRHVMHGKAGGQACNGSCQGKGGKHGAQGEQGASCGGGCQGGGHGAGAEGACPGRGGKGHGAKGRGRGGPGRGGPGGPGGPGHGNR